MRKYVGLTEYNKEVLEKILQSIEIEGIVLGDAFCQKRMFQYGDLDFYYYCDKILMAKKKIIYQTPCFMTDKKMKNVLLVIDFLQEMGHGSLVMVQDIGLLFSLSKRYKNLEICWSRLGRTRNNIMNYEFVNFLKEFGVCFMETDRVEHIAGLRNAGIQPCFIYGNLYYKSFGRVCYTCYQTERAEYDCDRTCLQTEYSLKEKCSQTKYKLDGFILNEEYRNVDKKGLSFVKTIDPIVGFYGKRWNDVKNNIKLWEAE